MTTHSNVYQLNTELTLHDSFQSPLTLNAITLTLTKLDDALISAHLTFQVNPESYQRIQTQSLFNLQPELRGSLSNGEFDNETNISITASLKPDLLSVLTPHLENAPACLQQLIQEDPNKLLLSPASWLGLQVKQHRLPKETGYRTFWDYLIPIAITAENVDSKQINTAIFKFFQDWVETHLESMTDEAISQALIEVNASLQECFDTSISAITSEVLTQVIAEIVNNFEQLADPNPFDNNQQAITSQNIFEVMVNFFISEDWPHAKIQGEPVLSMAFSGENGTWNCYATATVQHQQFIFYSICPTLAPENKRFSIAEFITRANSGMIIGNFELDLDTGEICYKTSIDVSEHRLNFALIKNLVYTNVTMMDKYLPGIMSVITGDILPESAIEQVELIADLSQSSESPEQLVKDAGRTHGISETLAGHGS
jgi:hypothetical protein